MKHTFKTLLGLVLVVFVLAGCSNPAGPEFSEVNETPVVETPEENIKLTKVEFRWGEYYNTSGTNKDAVLRSCGRYFLDLRSESFDDGVDHYDFVYDYPEGYDRVSFLEVINDKERLKKFCDDAFEKVFGTKYCKEGTVINLKKWTSKAVDLVNTAEWVTTYSNLYFSAEDVGRDYEKLRANSFDEIVIGNEDIVVYVYWDNYSFDL